LKPVIYTAVFGGYDALTKPQVVDSTARYVCFTDTDQPDYGVWEIRRVNHPELTPPMANRFYKINSRLHFPDAPVTIYHDGNMRMRMTVDQVLAIMPADADLMLPDTPRGIWSIDHELAAVVERRMAHPDMAIAQVSAYRNAGLDTAQRCPRCGILVRRATPAVAQFEAAWWSELQRWTHRDQLSFLWCAGMTGLRHHVMSIADRKRVAAYYPHDKARPSFGERDLLPITIVIEESGETFHRLGNALRASIARNCPLATVETIVEDGPIADNVPALAAHNTIKLRRWCDRMEAETDGNLMIFMDADTLVLGDLSPAFDLDFDVAYTVRPGRKRINAGVVFVRANDRSRLFFRDWLRINDEIMGDPRRLRRRMDHYGGVNQAALHSLLDAPHVARIGELPCTIWNSCDQTWSDFNEDCRVVHYKGTLRRLAMNGEQEPHRRWGELIDLWRQYDRVEVLEGAA